MAEIVPAGSNPPYTLQSVLTPVKQATPVPEAPKPPETDTGTNVNTQA